NDNYITIADKLFLDEIDLLKIIDWRINSEKYTFISVRSCLATLEQIRWQPTDIRPK
ncbi:unnamed protein product, partial [Rotaria sp. Silwood2]